MERFHSTHHDHKGEAVVKNQSPRMAEILKAIKFGSLQDCLEHRLDDEEHIASNQVVS
jgi:hypothetical protein